VEENKFNADYQYEFPPGKYSKEKGDNYQTLGMA